MTINTRTFKSNATGAFSCATDADTTTSYSRQFFVDPAKGAITTDIAGGFRSGGLILLCQ